MKQKKIIYSKRFPKILFEELEDINLKIDVDKLKSRYETDNDFMKAMANKVEFVLMKDRINRKNEFIRRVIKFTEEYEIDLDILQEEGSISVNIYLDCLFPMNGRLKELFIKIEDMADELILILPKDDIYMAVISLIFYTHQIYFNGKKMRNIDK